MSDRAQNSVRLRIIPFTLMIIGALAILKFSQTLQSVPSLSISGAKASILFPSKVIKTPQEQQVQGFDSEPDQVNAIRLPQENAANASVEERRLLERLRARREVLDMREASLDTREELLRAAEIRIDEKILALTAQEAAIDQREAVLREQNDADLEGIISAYERMKPRDAARVFDILDDELLVSVANGMRSQSLAGVLAQMSADRARTLTTLLAERRSVPQAVAAQTE